MEQLITLDAQRHGTPLVPCSQKRLHVVLHRRLLTSLQRFARSACPFAECECDSIFCGSCLRMLSACQCNQPHTQHLKCNICGYGIPGVIDKRVDALTDSGAVCSRCQSGDRCLATNWVSSSAHPCAECGRPDRQDFVDACNGADCSNLLHSYCSALEGDFAVRRACVLIHRFLWKEGQIPIRTRFVPRQLRISRVVCILCWTS